MNKKGFVFIETIVVLAILLVGIISIYTLYTKISTNIESRDYYDSINDIYKTKLLKDILAIDYSKSVVFFNSTNCKDYFISPYNDATKCKKIMEELHARQILITNYNYDSFEAEYTSSTEESNTVKIPNSLNNYLNTINLSDKKTKVLIVNYQYVDSTNTTGTLSHKINCFYNNDMRCKNYYSYLTIGGTNE